MTDTKGDRPAQGSGTIAIWGGEREHEPHERATQATSSRPWLRSAERREASRARAPGSAR